MIKKIVYNNMFIVLFPSIIFSILWGIILITNELTFIIIFLPILYITTCILTLKVFETKKYMLLLSSFLSFPLLSAYLFVGEYFLSDGLHKYELAGFISYLFCIPFAILIIFLILFKLLLNNIYKSE